PNTINKAHTTISKALNDALRHGLVVRNVASLATKPKLTQEEMKIYTPEQARRFLEAARGDRNEALYILMATTTRREGELLGLRWDCVDVDRAEIRIDQVLKEVGRSRYGLGTPKTARSRRTIPLAPMAVEALQRHHINQTVQRLKHGTGWNPHGLVFCT